MHTNPICHWSGASGPRPLFTWAPGDDREVDPTRTSLPNVHPFYNTLAELVAAGVPAPSYLHPCQEAAGSGTIIDVTGNGADLVLTGNAIQGQRSPQLWNPVAKNFYGYQKLGVQAESAVTNAGFVCANAALGNPGTGDMALFIAFRNNNTSSSMYTLSQKRNGSGAGWDLRVSVSTAMLYAETTAGVQDWTNASSSSLWGGQIIYVFAYIDRANAEMRIWHSCIIGGWTAAEDISAMGVVSISTTSPLAILGGVGASMPNPSANAMVLYHALWFGANATTMIAGWDATYRPILVPYSLGANDSPSGNLNSYNPITPGWASRIVGDDPLTGLCVGDFSTSPSGQQDDYSWNRDPLITRTSKFVAALGSLLETMVSYSESIENAAWTKSNVTVLATWAAMVNNPNGCRHARRLTATANAGYVQDTITTVVARVYTMDFLHRRGTAMGANVSGRLVAYNITGGAEIAAIAFTATDKWQRTYLEFTAVSVSTGFRIEITTNGEVIHVSRCTFYPYGFKNLPIQNYASSGYDTTKSNTHWRLMPSPAEAMDPIQGEIEIRARRYNNVANSTVQHIFRIVTGIAAGARNNRRIYLDTLNQIVAEIYNDAGGLVATMTSAAIDMTTERLIRLRWNTGGLPSGSTAELIIDANPPISGLLVPWATGLSADAYTFGSANTTSSSNMFDGSINYVKVWATPQ